MGQPEKANPTWRRQIEALMWRDANDDGMSVMAASKI